MGIVKRFLPFFATFVIGVLVASFFVSVGFSRFEGRGWRHRKGNHHKSMHRENERLRRENLELRQQLEQLRMEVPPVENTMPMESVPAPRIIVRGRGTVR